MRLVKIAVALTVEVDADEWELNYGTAADEVRRDVRGYAADAVLFSNPAIKSVKVGGV